MEFIQKDKFIGALGDFDLPADVLETIIASFEENDFVDRSGEIDGLKEQIELTKLAHEELLNQAKAEYATKLNNLFKNRTAVVDVEEPEPEPQDVENITLDEVIEELYNEQKCI